MHALIHRDRVLREVQLAVADALRLPLERVEPAHRVVADLGAESLDILDVNYRLEQAFGIRMARRFFLEHMEDLWGEGSAVDEQGRLTPLALAVVKERFRQAAPTTLGEQLDMDEVPRLITVDGIADAVMAILDTLPERCACTKGEWSLRDETHIVCSVCAQPPAFANGDDLTRTWLEQVRPQLGRVTA